MSLYIKEQPDYLHQCLSSLAAQTQPADEIIIVLDGAIHTALETVLTEFQAALPIHLCRLPENVGLGKALNFGLQHCSHEWVFRMDTDDIATPTRFAEQCAFIAQHPNIALLGGQIAEFDISPTQPHAMRSVPQTLPEILTYATKRNPFNHMTVAYQKAAVQAVSGYQHHLWMEDYNLWLRLLANNFQAANLPQTLVYVRAGSAMLTRRRGWSYIQSEWQLAQLKRQLGIQSSLSALMWFFIRSIPRMLPHALLKILYRVLRRPFQAA